MIVGALCLLGAGYHVATADVIGADIKSVERLCQQRDFKQAFWLLKQMAYTNDPIVQFYVGQLYLEGKGVDQDFEKAQDWFLRSLGSLSNLKAGEGYPLKQEMYQWVLDRYTVAVSCERLLEHDNLVNDPKALCLSRITEKSGPLSCKGRL